MQRRRKTANMAFVVTSIVSRLSSCATRLYNVGVVSHVNYWVFGFACHGPDRDRPSHRTSAFVLGLKSFLFLIARVL